MSKDSRETLIQSSACCWFYFHDSAARSNDEGRITVNMLIPFPHAYCTVVDLTTGLLDIQRRICECVQLLTMDCTFFDRLGFGP